MVLHFFDIGYGDAILIQTPEGGAVLVDTGKPENGPELVKAIQRLGVRGLDRILITHFHKDHAGGFVPIFDAFSSVKLQGEARLPRIIVPFIPDKVEAEIDGVLRVIKSQGYEIMRRGDGFPLSPSVRIEVLHPNGLIGNQNEDSMVLKIIHGNITVLLAADIGLKAQRELLEQAAQFLKSDLIKIPHHANEVFDSDFERFLQAVDPEIAVLTIGPNAYGAPNADMMALYGRRVSQIFRTDRHGTLKVTSNGLSLQVETERK